MTGSFPSFGKSAIPFNLCLAFSPGLNLTAEPMGAVEDSGVEPEAVKDAMDLNTFALLATAEKMQLDSIRLRISIGHRGQSPV